MSLHADHNSRGCASQAKLIYGKDAAARVAQQVEWARERGNNREILYWTGVLEALTEPPQQQA